MRWNGEEVISVISAVKLKRFPDRRKQCIDAMKRAVELSPTEPYRQRLAYFRRCRDAEMRGAEDNSIPFSSSEGEGR